MNIYVGNLSYDTTEEKIREIFEPFGQVESVSIITDRQTGRSRGFAFVIMPDDAEGQRAIDEANGKDLEGRALKVNQARKRTEGQGRGRRGGGGGGGGGGRRW
ncbi:MAG: RNA-binding protein [Phycisphaerae bacterium SM23_30]|nr:MAG: RNA-binding protein [Phycisphaerae bacterium SM23_30]